MKFSTRLLLFVAVLGWSATPAFAGEDEWSGTWVTDEGAMRLEQDGTKVEGDYGKNGWVEGEVEDGVLKGSYRVGNAVGTFEFTMQEGAHHFTGKWMHARGNSGAWRGWKQKDDAESKPAADFGGHWVTSIGTFRLEQKDGKVKGPWRHQGWSSVDGSVKGQRLNAKLKTPTWKGRMWLEMTADGKRVYGLTNEHPPAAVLGARVEGFEPNPKMEAGKISQGIAENGMMYFARPPDGWHEGKSVDAIVLLHGSNWTTKGMVWVTAKNWPEIAKNYMIVGIQGEQWSKFSDPPDLRFNYHYVNWMGKSTYKGYPYTDRDSPWAVSEVVKDLGKKHQWDRVFLGGHSQGGFLSFLMYMHYPELFAGVFPVAGGLVMQAEPDVFKDKKLIAAQKATPLAIVHGSNDNVVSYDTGLYIRERFEGAQFPMMRFIDPPQGHPYDFLPIDEAIHWLDAMSTPDTKVLAAYAKKAARAKDWATVSTLLARATALGAREALAATERKLDAAANKKAAKYLELLKDGKGGDWVDDFFVWKREFAQAPSARYTLAKYHTLRKKHDKKADALVSEARAAFRKNDRAGAKEMYEEIIEKHWASSRYPMVKRWLAGM